MQQQTGRQQAQLQMGRGQHLQGISAPAIAPSNIPFGRPQVHGRGNVSNIAAVTPAQVTSFSSNLFSLNGTPGTGTRSAVPGIGSSQYPKQPTHAESPATRTAAAPAFQVSSAAVGGNAQSVGVGPNTNGHNVVAKTAARGARPPR